MDTRINFAVLRTDDDGNKEVFQAPRTVPSGGTHEIITEEAIQSWKIITQSAARDLENGVLEQSK